MLPPFADGLAIDKFCQLFNRTTECYKFFWFKAIMSFVQEEQDRISFEEIIDRMISDAWYMVTEYNLNLGPNDTLAKAIRRVQQISGIKSAEKQTVLLDYLGTCKDKEICGYKKDLIKHVPYRLQSPFFYNCHGEGFWGVGKAKLTEKINQHDGLIYKFGDSDGLKTVITIEPAWYSYFRRNPAIVNGWLDMNLVLYLQRRNPSVPGITDKITPPLARDLTKVIKYWKKIITMHHDIYEIYDHELLTTADISIDHFIPWSYVAHDEFWNLHPTTKSINSSKSNGLPDWETYFDGFAHLQFFSYQLATDCTELHPYFKSCAREHINDERVREHLYHEGQTFGEFSHTLAEIVRPSYLSAQNCGFSNWKYRGYE